jgi:hypothetical protein
MAGGMPCMHSTRYLVAPKCRQGPPGGGPREPAGSRAAGSRAAAGRRAQARNAVGQEARAIGRYPASFRGPGFVSANIRSEAALLLSEHPEVTTAGPKIAGRSIESGHTRQAAVASAGAYGERLSRLLALTSLGVLIVCSSWPAPWRCRRRPGMARLASISAVDAETATHHRSDVLRGRYPRARDSVNGSPPSSPAAAAPAIARQLVTDRSRNRPMR